MGAKYHCQQHDCIIPTVISNHECPHPCPRKYRYPSDGKKSHCDGGDVGSALVRRFDVACRCGHRKGRLSTTGSTIQETRGAGDQPSSEIDKEGEC